MEYLWVGKAAQNMHPFLLSFWVPLSDIGTYDHFEGEKNGCNFIPQK